MFLGGDYQGIIVLTDDEGNSARMVVERLVVRIFRHGTGAWQLGSVKIVGGQDTIINPGWKTNKPVDRPADYDEAADTRIFAAVHDAIVEATYVLHMEGGGDNEE
jgi:hypothetical protein